MTLPIPEDQANWLLTADPRTLRLPLFLAALSARCQAAGLVRLDNDGSCRLTGDGLRMKRLIQARLATAAARAPHRAA